ncbi:hypothetical protein HDU93_002854 [Gonapodya sp. JEL0774]|nr:hypothetical protein HDU93_002854 [Gonapodya sp. JEL0774]
MKDLTGDTTLASKTGPELFCTDNMFSEDPLDPTGAGEMDESKEEGSDIPGTPENVLRDRESMRLRAEIFELRLQRMNEELKRKEVAFRRDMETREVDYKKKVGTLTDQMEAERRSNSDKLKAMEKNHSMSQRMTGALIHRLQTELDSTQPTLQAQLGKHDALKSEMEALKKQIAKTEEENRQLRQKIAILDAGYLKKKNTGLQSEVDGLRLEVNGLREQLQAADEKCEKFRREWGMELHNRINANAKFPDFTLLRPDTPE